MELPVGLISFVSWIMPVQSFAAAMSENPLKKQNVKKIERVLHKEPENLAPWANCVSSFISLEVLEKQVLNKYHACIALKLK
jgi:hypothetical protein